MTPEQKFWQLIKDHVPGHVIRVESVVGSGVPDVNYCHQGNEMWLELKANIGLNLDNIPRLKSVPGLVGYTFKLSENVHKGKIRDSQLIWHSTRVKNGGYVLLATRDKDFIHILVCSGYDTYTILYSGKKPWDWVLIERVLGGGDGT